MLALLARPTSKASELVNQSICRCIPHICRFFEDRAKTVFEQQFKKVLDPTMKVPGGELRGAAYCCAGIIKCFGMKFLREKNILGQVQAQNFAGKKTEPIKIQSGLQLYETLAFALGKSFEPFVKEILQNILNCISHASEAVRASANQTNK